MLSLVHLRTICILVHSGTFVKEGTLRFINSFTYIYSAYMLHRFSTFRTKSGSRFYRSAAIRAEFASSTGSCSIRMQNRIRCCLMNPILNVFWIAETGYLKIRYRQSNLNQFHIQVRTNSCSNGIRMTLQMKQVLSPQLPAQILFTAPCELFRRLPKMSSGVYRRVWILRRSEQGLI